MKKLIIGCMAGIAAIISFVGCEQDNMVYKGPNYLMFSDTLYRYAVQETNEIFNVPIAATTAVDYDRNLAVEIIDKESCFQTPSPSRRANGLPTSKCKGCMTISKSPTRWGLPCA